MIIIDWLQMMWKQASDTEQDFIECDVKRDQVNIIRIKMMMMMMMIVIMIMMMKCLGFPPQLAGAWDHPHLQEEH